MKDQLAKMREDAVSMLEKTVSIADAEALRIKYLGKKGELTAILRQMGRLGEDERPMIGQLANEVREAIGSALEKRIAVLESAALEQRLEGERIDVTLPGKRRQIGKKHPFSIIHDEIVDIFVSMGFTIAEGPEVELDHYNFEMLNMPKGHPARDTQDTFYVSENVLLRTQTSSVQIRYMENNKPPIRMISPGRVYRSDTLDATHSPIFYQVEGLVVDKGITFGDLKGTLEGFARSLFGESVRVRFRPHHFPYTEPSAEMDFSCFICNGAGCRLCKNEGFIELLGSGVVHPQVLRNVGIDPDIYSGFAFGMGIERNVMRSFKLDDLRLLYENDIRFLHQF